MIGRPQSLPIPETSQCNPTSIYGANRLTSEYYCKIFNQLYDLDTLIFRITNSFGPREQSLTPTKNAINFLIHHAFEGKEITEPISLVAEFSTLTVDQIPPKIILELKRFYLAEGAKLSGKHTDGV